MKDLFLKIVTVVGIIVVTAVLGLLLAFPIKWAWNYVMPYVFNLPAITWGQAWCLNFLAGFLIKSTLTTTKEK